MHLISMGARLQRISLGAAALALVGCSTAAQTDSQAKATTERLLLGTQQAWRLRLPQQDEVFFQGAVNRDSTKGAGTAIVYPVYGVAGLLVAVAAHAAIEGGMQNHKKSKEQAQADEVLNPYQPLIKSLSSKALMQQALDQLSSTEDKALIDFSALKFAGWNVQGPFIFSMTQDQKAIFLDQDFIFQAPQSHAQPSQPYSVRVIYNVPTGDNALDFWTTRQGENLKKISVQLLKESIELALSDLPYASQDASEKTIRYAMGDVEKVERGQIVKESCDRLIIKTLRGGLLYAPRTKSMCAVQP
jgi:hypothetical protein